METQDHPSDDIVVKRLERQCQNLKQELSAELNLRQSLECSHKTLLLRIDQMEKSVQIERTQVQNLKVNQAKSSEKEQALLKELQKHHLNQSNFTEHSQLLEKTLMELTDKYNKVLEDKTYLSNELKNLTNKYQDLMNQIEKARDQESRNRIVRDNKQIEISKLQEVIRSSSVENAALISDYEQHIEKLRLSSAFGEKSKEKISCLESELKELSKLHAIKSEENESLRDSLNALKQQLTTERQEQSTIKDRLTNKIEELQRQVKGLSSELQVNDKKKCKLKTLAETFTDDLKSKLVDSEKKCVKLEKSNLNLKKKYEEIQLQNNQLMKDNSFVKRLEADLQQSQNQCSVLASSLEDLVTSHTRLQQAETESCSRLFETEKELKQQQLLNEENLNQVKELEMKLSSTEEAYDSFKKSSQSKLKTVNHKLNEAEIKNNQLSLSLDEFKGFKSCFEDKINQLKDQIQIKMNLLTHLKEARIKDQTEHKQEIVKLQEQLAVKKSTHKDSSKCVSTPNLDKLCDCLSVVEADRSRLELKNKEISSELSKTKQDLIDAQKLLSSQQNRIQRLNQLKLSPITKSNKENNVANKDQVNEMKQLKSRYIKKNKEQAEAIAEFVKQIDTLRSELSELKSRENQEQSTEVSPQDSLTSELETLRDELCNAKQCQDQLEKQMFDKQCLIDNEREKTEFATIKAQELMRQSRETICRLAKFAEVVQAETHDKMTNMSQRLQTEQQLRHQLQNELVRFKESSLRHTESLAAELSFYQEKSF